MSSVKTSSTPLTFTQKQERNLRKKARQEEERFKNTGDEGHLRKRDEWNDQADTVKKNAETDKQKKKVMEAQKSDDQLLNEAKRQNRRERNEADVKKQIQESKKNAMNARRAELKKMMKEKKENMDGMKKKYEELVEKEKIEENTAKVEFSKEYNQHHPNASDSEIQKEYVKHLNALEKGENLKGFYIRNMVGLTGKDVDEILSDYEKMNTEFREKNNGLLEREIIELFEEECKILLTEMNCRIKFVEEVIKMTGEKKEQVEKEYDDDYKKFKEYANENGYTRTVAVDKYIELSNKKLQVAQFRYTVVNKMMEDQGMDVDEANQEFDKMMYAMNQEENACKEPMCIKCD